MCAYVWVGEALGPAPAGVGPHDDDGGPHHGGGRGRADLRGAAACEGSAEGRASPAPPPPLRGPAPAASS